MKAWKFSEFETLADSDIKKEIEDLFSQLTSGYTGMQDKIPVAIIAQLFLNELNRRNQNKQTRAMLWCTYAITGMTLLILVATAAQVCIQWRFLHH